MSRIIKLIHRLTHVILCACSKTCPECGSPCVNTFNHQDGEHSCGDHSW
jgi:hypothetical protein